MTVVCMYQKIREHRLPIARQLNILYITQVGQLNQRRRQLLLVVVTSYLKFEIHSNLDCLMSLVSQLFSTLTTWIRLRISVIREDFSRVMISELALIYRDLRNSTRDRTEDVRIRNEWWIWYNILFCINLDTTKLWLNFRNNFHAAKLLPQW